MSRAVLDAVQKKGGASPAHLQACGHDQLGGCVWICVQQDVTEVPGIVRGNH